MGIHSSGSFENDILSLSARHFLGLTDADFALLDRHLALLSQASEALARRFYDHLLSYPATAAVFRDFPPERLQRLLQTQADHAEGLLANHLDDHWIRSMAEIGRRHYRLGVEPDWMAGAYTLYWDYWDGILERADMVPDERRSLRRILLHLCFGDLMAQLRGYGQSVRETDAERMAIFDVLLQTLLDPQITEDRNGTHLLSGVCAGLVSKSAAVAWSGYFIREGAEETLIPQCLEGAGAGRDGLHIPKTSEDPAWQALETHAPVIWRHGETLTPDWLQPLGKEVSEVACFPFGSGDLSAVGVVAVWQKGYFQRVGSTYFLAFAHLGDLILSLRTQALRDPLTGLPNRQLFFDRLEHDRQQSLRREHLLGVGIFDLDGFKQVNDQLGHGAGDDLLRQVAGRIQNLLRTGDTIARFGGDEFGLLLPDLERVEDLEVICARIMEELRRPFALGEDIASLSASIGFTLYPLDGSDAENLLHHADLALYSAKRHGKDQCQTHTWMMDERISSQAAQREYVAQALEESRLLLHYQPIVSTDSDARDQSVLGVEALLRLDDGKGGRVVPGVFADSLDHPRLARSIGLFVLDAALSQGEIWHGQGLRLRVSVNISTRHLLDVRFIADLEEALARYPGIPADHIEIEVTESAPLKDFEKARHVLAQVNALGARVGLDDFGTGNASLTYLQKLPTQTIKIDRSFVHDIVDDPRDLAIVAAVITAARLLGLEVVAEGVETARHAQLLNEMHCHLLQGYLIAKPMPAAAIPEWVAQYHMPVTFITSAFQERESSVLIGHYHRVQQFIAALRGEEPFPEHVLEPDAYQKCHLGLWLQMEGFAQFGDDPAYPIITARHQRLHHWAMEAKVALDAGQKDEALRKGRRLEMENDALLAEIRVLMADQAGRSEYETKPPEWGA
ncbi:EAL domain-containing protein [Acidithiobacillus ferrooxidans]|uniref:EAL domain-containing protein n=1 Tax=Acidithiobacillus ferrooxidans TaxID=920 RepID=UPI00214B87CA|nr:EAL domain-containing protein [Acidithiobacillus ferrooxidans]MCR2832063.1 EAL domain-containing protein [Acidithiobacillus ferrooxidans]